MGGGVGRIRLVAVDLDGTLLDPQGCITPRTHDTIERLADHGVTLALATGRRWTGAAIAASALAFRGPMIHMDGAVVRAYPDGQVLSKLVIRRELVKRAATRMTQYGIQPIVQYSEEQHEYIHVAKEASNPAWTASYLDMFQQQVRFCPVAELCDVDFDPVRLVAFAPLNVLRRVAVDLASPECGRQLLLLGNYGVAELSLFAADVSKGNALAMLARRLDIPLEETMAVGDGPNDISMLRMAGLGVAMGNAPRRVRMVADVVTGSNAEEGLARALEKYVLQDAHLTPSFRLIH
jgi:Cof subfamily protein (haloacid dehalogenase superfamily)